MMNTLLARLNSLGKSRKGGFLVLGLTVLATLAWVQIQGRTTTGLTNHNGSSPLLSSIHPKTGIQLRANLSQPMVLQGGDGTAYLDLTVLTPKTNEDPQTATDTIVVLDRSGSMGDDNKWRYATQAVYTLLNQLRPDDRIALITFDTQARVNSRLLRATEENTLVLTSAVSSLRPGGHTNLGAALLLAEGIASGSTSSERRSRIILLSDGLANKGIVEPAALGSISRRIADRGSIVSTIGMGLGFNEMLMASLADHGMGSFHFLEDLESLGTLLAGELSDSRFVLAEGSELRIHLPHGVEIHDVAGLPFVLEGRTAVIRTGQLFQNSTKHFLATLRVNSEIPAEYRIQDIELNYRVDGRPYRQEIATNQLKIACVQAEREDEVLASVDHDIYEDAWIRNNLGAVMRSVGDLVRSGKREEAKELMTSYRGRLDKADAMVPGLKKKAESQLQELEERVDDAFEGVTRK
jgi:Ca-activated chloride channel family protein